MHADTLIRKYQGSNMGTLIKNHEGYLLNILFVEDDPSSARAARQMLEKNGCHVDTCENGEDSLKNVDSKYDLILLDLELPGMDGFAVASAIRQMKGNVASLPIVALTASESTEILVRAREIGINGFLTKPFSSNKCKMLLNQYKCRH